MQQSVVKNNVNIIITLLTFIIVVVNNLNYSPDFELRFLDYFRMFLFETVNYFICYSIVTLLIELFGISYRIKLHKIFLVVSFIVAFIVWYQSYDAIFFFSVPHFLIWYYVPIATGIVGILGAILNNGILEYHYPKK